MDYLEEAIASLKEGDANGYQTSLQAAAGYALVAIAQELRRFNDRAEDEIDRQEMLAESEAVRDLYAS